MTPPFAGTDTPGGQNWALEVAAKAVTCPTNLGRFWQVDLPGRGVGPPRT
jgi:hypothetical protein